VILGPMILFVRFKIQGPPHSAAIFIDTSGVYCGLRKIALVILGPMILFVRFKIQGPPTAQQYLSTRRGSIAGYVRLLW